MTRFQTIFIGILVLIGVGGAILFAVSKNKGSEGAQQVIMWGTASGLVMSDFLSDASVSYKDTVNVSYVEKDPATFETELIAALARGQGPDLVLLPHDLIVRQLDKFYMVPYENYSARIFRDSYIQQGELYMFPQGIVGFPFSIDPLVMYWNREIFANAGVALPPSSWTDFFALAPKIVQKDQNGNISQSLVAFGEVRNVARAKEVLSLLAMQAGTPIVARDSQGRLSSAFADRGESLVPAEQALSYFTEFSNPSKQSYSWNRSLLADRNAFTAGRLAVYFGYASELGTIRASNPNLNFDVAEVPQVSGKRVSYGAMTGVAILRSSPNLAGAFNTAVIMSSAPLQTLWAETTGLPPVRRDLITTLPGDPYKAVFYQSALIANAWLDPYREATYGVFQRLVEGVTSGKLRVSEAVSAASIEIDTLLRGTL